METSLLKTKTAVPPGNPHRIDRERLLDRFQDALACPVVLVSASAGFGKTTLVSDWAHREHPGMSIAWVSLDERDNDPVRFWDYLLAALQRDRPSFGKDIVPLLHAARPVPAEVLLDHVINELAVLPHSLTLVLDDYHFINLPQIHEAVTYLCLHLPANLRLIIVSRADPPLPLASFRGKGLLAELRSDDLRFTSEEAARLLRALQVAGVSGANVDALTRKTEGWAVGLKMAALSMEGRADKAAFVDSFTGSQRYIMDYLLEEVLRKQTEATRDFLCKTSVLEHLCGPLCDAVTGQRDGDVFLDQLNRGHLFMVALDETGHWYRYEHLFGELLRHQCQKSAGAEGYADLHRLAAGWYEANGYTDDAIHHALAAEDWEPAIRLMVPRSEELRNRAEWRTLLEWLRKVPEPVLRDNHRLYSQYAGFLASVGQIDAAWNALTYLETAAGDDTVLQADVAFLLSIIANRRNESARVQQFLEKSIALAPPEDLAIRPRAMFSMAWNTFQQGRLREAEEQLTGALAYIRRGSDTWLTASALGVLANFEINHGRLDRAMDLAEDAVKLAGETQGAAAGLSVLSQIQYERNKLDAATENARLAAAWYERGGNPESALLAYCIDAQACLVRGDTDGTLAALAKGERATRDPSLVPFFASRHAALRTMIALRQDDMETAVRWARRLSDSHHGKHPEFARVPARLLIAQGRQREAAAYLAELYERLDSEQAHGLMLGTRVSQALAAETEDEALAFLDDALARGEPEGYVRSFVDEHDAIKPLLRKALAKGGHREYARRLLDVMEQETLLRKSSPGGPPLLSARETDILRLMAAEIPNQEIGERLAISLSTVKTHVHHILDKLEAKDRSQAVYRARELGLL